MNNSGILPPHFKSNGFSLMNVTFNGYLTLTCEGCQKKLTVESKELSFEQDTSPEAEDDQYIRYLTQVDTRCEGCSAKLHVKLDVWEYPEAVANYSYHGEQGANDIQCEFNIEHYFDGEPGQENAGAWRSASSDGNDDLENDNRSEGDDEGNIRFNEDDELNGVASYDGYQDHYDEEDN